MMVYSGKKITFNKPKIPGTSPLIQDVFSPVSPPSETQERALRQPCSTKARPTWLCSFRKLTVWFRNIWAQLATIVSSWKKQKQEKTWSAPKLGTMLWSRDTTGHTSSGCILIPTSTANSAHLRTDVNYVSFLYGFIMFYDVFMMFYLCFFPKHMSHDLCDFTLHIWHLMITTLLLTWYMLYRVLVSSKQFGSSQVVMLSSNVTSRRTLGLSMEIRQTKCVNGGYSTLGWLLRRSKDNKL